MEDERKINWLSLFIKIIIVFVFILIVIWLVSKIVGKKEPSEIFKSNLDNMEKVALEYFKTIDLPLEKEKSKKITLEEMIDKKIIISFSENSENKCEAQESYSKITRKDNNYLVETTLICGDEKDTKVHNFSFDDCKNCQEKNESSQDENNDSHEDNTPPSNNNNPSANLTTYYEFVKETTSYTKWMRGSLIGNNIENKYEYYAVAYDTYYSLAYIKANEMKKGQSFTYTLKVDKVPNRSYYFMIVDDSKYFSVSEEKSYLNERDISVYKGNNPNTLSGYSTIADYSLKENNFTYKLSPYYQKGSFYISVKITINNTDNIVPYYDNKIKNDIYFIPLKLNIRFASNKITTTKPSGNYVEIPYYRYVTVNKETVWSTENYLEGYTKTGNIKYE